MYDRAIEELYFFSFVFSPQVHIRGHFFTDHRNVGRIHLGLDFYIFWQQRSIVSSDFRIDIYHKMGKAVSQGANG
jgi:hypothetical protein